MKSVTSHNNITNAENKRGGDNTVNNIINFFLLLFIACIGLSALWIINTLFGQFLTTQYWLLTIGIVGSICVVTFLKHHRH